jgi:hypothetical protein
MHRSSESIANLAAALAKAQGELVNPEKSLQATIHSDRRGGVDKTFRYAPLSSGLDIVRKTLGQHEIATVQATAIDQTLGLVNLTTVLAHSSGEWIASDWPVCAITDTATPHRMGAALTYARRYALFTLVGIAGEDDVDAPDLPTSTGQLPVPARASAKGNGRPNGGRSVSSTEPTLGAEASAELRDRLIGELTSIVCSDDAASWAHRSLSEKNKLIAADARLVEEAFGTKLATASASESRRANKAEKPRAQRRSHAPQPKTSPRAREVDKSVLALSEPRRVRDREHTKYITKQPCLICGRTPSDAHHLRFAQSRALGSKVSDEFTVPLCRGHHREVHRCTDEISWWHNAGLDPLSAARKLWLEMHPLTLVANEIDAVSLPQTFK